jgi:predicted lipoprotein with Yx(FWY)xxD motif
MKKVVLIGIVFLLCVVGFAERHKIKSMLVGAPAIVPVTQAPVIPAPSDNIYLTKVHPKKGPYLTDFQNLTLYTYDNDTNGVSMCYNDCVKMWPIYTSGATAQSQFPENITVITRTDGSKQFAWKGKPLYYYTGDQNVGDMNGDGVGGVWHIVKP